MNHIKYLFQLVLIVIYTDIGAQVPVIKEPHHKPVLVNNYVRLLDVHIKPNDTTLYHTHATPSIIVIISNSTIGMQKLGEAASPPANVLAGATSFVDYGTNPISHRVFNMGSNVFHVMDIELVRKNPFADSCAALQQNNVETTINEKLVRVYKFDAHDQQQVILQKNNCAHLLVCVSGTVNALNKKIITGDYIFFNPNTKISVLNQQRDSATCVLLELK